MAKRYTVSDGKLMLVLEQAEEGGFIVTSPLDPSLVTEADTIPEAFEMARDALRTLAHGRAKLRRNGTRRRRIAE
jgi:predicted RNase H-like HicB family nuclease